MKPMQVPDLRDGYVEIVKFVRDHGRVREARGYKAYDVADAVFTVMDTTQLLPYGTGRDPKEEIAYAEALLLCAGVASPSLLTAVAPTFARFVDGGQLQGAYGPFVRPQMEHVITILRGDPDSRQAVVQLHPGLHNVMGLSDVPCTLSIGFELREDGLHVRATMRSNDAWLGLTYDAFMFGQLGWTVANVLGAELKTYTHHAYSLHVYERDVDRIERLHACDPDLSPEPRGFGYIGGSLTYEGVRRRAEDLYNGGQPVGESFSESQYRSCLSRYNRLTRSQNFKT